MSFASVKSYPRSSFTEKIISGQIGKRCFDLAFTTLLIPIVLPLLAAVSIFLVLQGNDVFYSQLRVGKNGKLFRIWKFRTMHPDAENILPIHLARNTSAAKEWRQTRKLYKDPRITGIGHFLRKSSLDELPQFWNILRGEMSLVGPRPVLPDELTNKYGGFAPFYTSCRPGLTGLWQVSGRNLLDYKQRVNLDITYAKKQGLLLDLNILWRTIGVVIRGTGC